MTAYFPACLQAPEETQWVLFKPKKANYNYNLTITLTLT